MTRLEIKETIFAQRAEENEKDEKGKNSTIDEYLNQGDRESLVVGSREEEEAKKKGSGLAQERGFFGSSPATSANFSRNLFLILILGLWTV